VSNNFAFLHELEDWSELRVLSEFEGGFNEAVSEKVDSSFLPRPLPTWALLMILIWVMVEDTSAKMDGDLMGYVSSSPAVIHLLHALII